MENRFIEKIKNFLQNIKNLFYKDEEVFQEDIKIYSNQNISWLEADKIILLIISILEFLLLERFLTMKNFIYQLSLL